MEGDKKSDVRHLGDRQLEARGGGRCYLNWWVEDGKYMM